MPTWTFSVTLKLHLLFHQSGGPSLRVRARKGDLRPRQLFGLLRHSVEGRDDPKLSYGLRYWGQGDYGLSRPCRPIVDKNQNTRRPTMEEIAVRWGSVEDAGAI